jgi:cell division protein FtsI (penicillin-binding protein 3)
MRDDGRNGGTRRRPDARRTQHDRRRESGSGAGHLTLDGRVRLLRVVFIVFFLAIAGRAVALTSTEGNLARIARQQQVRSVTIPAPRGAIVDRNGEALAVGQERRTLYATPYMLDDPEAAADLVADTLKLKKKERRVLRRSLSDGDSGFAFIARKVDVRLAESVMALDLPGVGA